MLMTTGSILPRNNLAKSFTINSWVSHWSRHFWSELGDISQEDADLSLPVSAKDLQPLDTRKSDQRLKSSVNLLHIPRTIQHRCPHFTEKATILFCAQLNLALSGNTSMHTGQSGVKGGNKPQSTPHPSYAHKTSMLSSPPSLPHFVPALLLAHSHFFFLLLFHPLLR